MDGDGNGRGAIGEGGEGGEGGGGEATDDALDALDTALLPRTGRRLERLRRPTERRIERQGAIKTIESAQHGKRGRHKERKGAVVSTCMQGKRGRHKASTRE